MSENKKHQNQQAKVTPLPALSTPASLAAVDAADDTGATRPELEKLKADLIGDRNNRLQVLANDDATIRFIEGALKGVEFALSGPPVEAPPQ
tara:strand:- start:501 stop:776 length:276 start_codon:yes stop_codon:yes gene_type:complete